MRRWMDCDDQPSLDRLGYEVDAPHVVVEGEVGLDVRGEDGRPEELPVLGVEGDAVPGYGIPDGIVVKGVHG